jgi:hypothetical protein
MTKMEKLVNSCVGLTSFKQEDADEILALHRECMDGLRQALAPAPSSPTRGAEPKVREEDAKWEEARHLIHDLLRRLHDAFADIGLDGGIRGATRKVEEAMAALHMARSQAWTSGFAAGYVARSDMGTGRAPAPSQEGG